MDPNTDARAVCRMARETDGREKPVFSVVMPVYNAGAFLGEAIRSVLAQEMTDFELIIVDDGSTDGSATTCRAAVSRDPRVTLIDQPNAGPGAAMNAGISVARAQWVVVMHADDVMMPTRLGRLQEAISSNSQRVGIIASRVQLIASDGRKLGVGTPDLAANPYYLRSNNDRVVGGLYHTAIRMSALESVGFYNNLFRLNEDVDIYNRIVEHGYGILILDDILMQYRIHGHSASNASARDLFIHWRFIKACAQARRYGAPEPSWHDFLALRRARTRRARLNEWRKDEAKALYRGAASAYSNRRWTTFALSSLFSVFLRPSYYLSKCLTRHPLG